MILPVNTAEESSDSTAESTLCSEEIKPISSFMNNRRKMLEVAFSAVDADQLKEIIPPFLKDSTLDELKLACYEELRCLTDEAMKSILEGVLERTTCQRTSQTQLRHSQCCPLLDTCPHLAQVSSRRSPHYSDHVIGREPSTLRLPFRPLQCTASAPGWMKCSSREGNQ